MASSRFTALRLGDRWRHFSLDVPTFQTFSSSSSSSSSGLARRHSAAFTQSQCGHPVFGRCPPPTRLRGTLVRLHSPRQTRHVAAASSSYSVKEEKEATAKDTGDVKNGLLADKSAASKAGDSKTSSSSSSSSNNNNNNTSNTITKEEAEDGNVPLSRMLSLAWPERTLLAIGVALNALASGASLLLPRVFGVVVDGMSAKLAGTVPPPGLLSALTPTEACVGMLALYGVQAFIVAARGQILAQAGEAVSARTRNDALTNMIRQDVAFFDKTDSGELLNRLSADAGQLRTVVTSTIVQALRSGTMALGAAGMLIWISPKLACLSLAVFPPIFVVAAWQGRRMRAEQKRVQDSLAESTSVAQRLLANIRTLRALGAEEVQASKYRESVEMARSDAVKVGKTQAIFEATVHFAANCSLLAILGCGGSMVLDGSLSPGDLSSFLMYSLFLGFSSSGLSSTVAELQRVQGSSQRILELLDQVPDMKDGTKNIKDLFPLGTLPDGHPLKHTQAAAEASSPSTPSSSASHAFDSFHNSSGIGVVFEDIHFKYPAREDVKILQGFSLIISPGDRVGITGVSGCGKSTLFRLLSRLYDPDSGRVRLVTDEGKSIDIRDIHQKQLRGGLVGVVPQEPILVAGTIEDNILLGCRRSDVDLEAAVDAVGLRQVLSRLPDGLLTQVGEQGVQLSGGEKQRVALARLVVVNPPIVLLDEFTSALDKTTASQICANLREVTRGRTVLAIVHDEDVLGQLGVQRRVHLGAHGAVLIDDEDRGSGGNGAGDDNDN